MNISLQKIEKKARELAQEGKSWHFHILTPDCTFNKKDSYAFILENATDEEVFVFYSAEPQMSTGKKLVKLIHGDDVVQEDQDKPEEAELPIKVKQLLKKAKKMNEKGSFWHHHMLLPDCTFNETNGKWVIVFEDQETGQAIQSVSDEEPRAALKEIETLFYEQKA